MNLLKTILIKPKNMKLANLEIVINHLLIIFIIAKGISIDNDLI